MTREILDWQPPPDADVQQAFARVVKAVTDGDDAFLAATVWGNSTRYGYTLRHVALEETAGFEGDFTLEGCDPATRLALSIFWGTDIGGMIGPDMHPNELFAAALLYSPMSRFLAADCALGGLAGKTEDGHAVYPILHRGEETGRHVVVAPKEGDGEGLAFDIMALMLMSAELLKAFVADQYEGDFAAFLDGYFDSLDTPYHGERIAAAEQRIRDKRHG